MGETLADSMEAIIDMIEMEQETIQEELSESGEDPELLEVDGTPIQDIVEVGSNTAEVNEEYASIFSENFERDRGTRSEIHDSFATYQDELKRRRIRLEGLPEELKLDQERMKDTIETIEGSIGQETRGYLAETGELDPKYRLLDQELANDMIGAQELDLDGEPYRHEKAILYEWGAGLAYVMDEKEDWLPEELRKQHSKVLQRAEARMVESLVIESQDYETRKEARNSGMGDYERKRAWNDSRVLYREALDEAGLGQFLDPSN